MNILAHLYLSGPISELMLGNYIGDFIKGNQYLSYPAEMQKGILMHRQIDDFTDRHPIHKQTRDLFRPSYKLHSGIVTDIVYDHFLANNWPLFHSQVLEDYASDVYHYLNIHYDKLPEGMRKFTPMMIQNNWLVLYRSVEGVERVLKGMSRYTSLPDKTNDAVKIIRANEKELNEMFLIFMNDLKNAPFF
jgi:acyl carrier protein phosphodiesterase